MQCYVCGKDMGDKLGACEDCRVKKDTQRELEHRAFEEVHKGISSNPEFKPIYLLIAGVVFFIGGISALLIFSPSSFPEVSLEAPSGLKRVPCFSGRPCAIAYLTPECPTCQETIKTVGEIENEILASGARDFYVVVGSNPKAPSSVEQIRDFASYSPIPSLMDFDGEIAASLSLKNFPVFLSIGPKRGIIDSVAGYPSSASLEQRIEWVKNNLPLPKQ